MSVSAHRLRNILVALLLALAAMAATLTYVSRSRAQDRAQGSAASVLVASRDIPVGTAAAQLALGGWIAVESVPSSALVPDAITRRADLDGLVATQTIYAGEQLTTRRFGTARQEGLRATLTGALRIVELPGDAHQLLAGTLRDGDRVDVVASIRSPEGGQTHYSRMVLRDLLVVRAPAGTGGATALGTSADVSADIQHTDEQAQRLFWVEKNADWSLALRPGERASDTPAPPASAATVLGSSHGR